MTNILRATVAVAVLVAASAFSTPVARAEGFSIGIGNGGVAFSYESGGYCDRWGCPDDYWDYPVYDCPVYYRGDWYRGPVYYRRHSGRTWYWIHGDWRLDEWRGSRPGWACMDRYRPALGFEFYERNGFRIRDDWRRRWHDQHDRGRDWHGRDWNDRDGHDRDRHDRGWNWQGNDRRDGGRRDDDRHDRGDWGRQGGDRHDRGDAGRQGGAPNFNNTAPAFHAPNQGPSQGSAPNFQNNGPRNSGGPGVAPNSAPAGQAPGGGSHGGGDRGGDRGGVHGGDRGGDHGGNQDIRGHEPHRPQQ